MTTILEKLNKDTPNTAPFYFSDMVPYGGNIKTTLTVIDSRIKNVNQDKYKNEAYLTGRLPIDTAISFHICLHEAYDAYSRVSQFITNHTGESPFKDDQLDRFFQSRMWGDRSTAEQHLKRIAKNETRAGILNRLDL